MEDPKTTAVLGTGIMGGAMAEQLLEAGHGVRVWNRTPQRAERLEREGATIAATPTEAAEGADFVWTVVTDADAVRAVLDRSEDLLEQLEPETIWLQSSTVGVDDTREFAARAERAGVGFVDAPLLGTKEPAEAGALTVLAASKADLEEQCRPVFDAVGSKTLWLGAPPAATSLKLVCNTWVVGLLGTLAESVALAEHLDVPPEHFLDAIAGGPLDANYAQLKGQMMISESFDPSFPLKHALKDANLIRRAARERGLEVSVVEGVADLLQRGVDDGHGDLDMAAAIEALRSTD